MLDLFDSDIDDIDDDTEYLETKNTLILRTSKTLDWNNVRPPLSLKMQMLKRKTLKMKTKMFRMRTLKMKTLKRKMLKNRH